MPQVFTCDERLGVQTGSALRFNFWCFDKDLIEHFTTRQLVTTWPAAERVFVKNTGVAESSGGSSGDLATDLEEEGDSLAREKAALHSNIVEVAAQDRSGEEGVQ